VDDNVFQSYEILECIDSTEYTELTAAKKATMSTVLSCGHVDLNDGKAGKTMLWNVFGAESATVTALEALIDS